MTELDLTFVQEAISKHGSRPEAALPLLGALQDHYGYLPQEALEQLCRLSEITPATLAGISTFYDRFRHQPVGRHMISVCCGTACHVKGSESIWNALRARLGLPDQCDTDASGEFTLRKVACLGCCTLAPAVQIDQVTYGHLAPDLVPRMLRDFRRLQNRRPAAPAKLRADGVSQGRILLGMGSCCVARGSGEVSQTLGRELSRNGLNVSVKRVGCVGMCHQTPMLEVSVLGASPTIYSRVTPRDVPGIVRRHFRPPGMLRRLSAGLRNAAGSAIESLLNGRFLTDQAPLERHILDRKIELRDPPVEAFLGPQVHLATEHCGQIDPLDLDEYMLHDGFEALRRAREMEGADLVEQIRRSQLAGRGGAGYPAARKWAAVRDAPGAVKYVICNGDEGDPGAFMDRMLLESYPYRVIEGMAVAALAVGASEGILYIRSEYPLAVQRVSEAIGKCRLRGVLEGPCGRALSLRVFQGAGAFVCGEETALIASIEGGRGMPRLRPPYPAQRGLWGRPTLVNNVETFALVPWIVRNGAAAFAALGTEASKGTKVFALAGKVARGGLVEVPMGVTIEQIVHQIGGGVADGKAFKAVQIGGPSGGCLSASACRTPVDYQAMSEAGAIMGSGGLVVLDEDDCMVEIARYFLEFTQNQSCGRCTFCRVGTRRMLDILERLCGGQARTDDLEELEHLAWQVRQGSLCGLGKTAPNPVLTTLRYFRDEYEAHLKGRCPAGQCKQLIRYSITDDCIGCTRCAQHCPADAIAMQPYRKQEIDDAKCTRCGMCRTVCPSRAVIVMSRADAPKAPPEEPA